MRIESCNAVVGKIVFFNGVVLNGHHGGGTERNGDKLAGNKHLGLANVASGDGIAHVKDGENTLFGVYLLALDRAVRERSRETVERDVLAFLCCLGSVQVDTALGHCLCAKQQSCKEEY